MVSATPKPRIIRPRANGTLPHSHTGTSIPSSDSTARLALDGRGGKMVQAQTDAGGTLERLVVRYPAERPEWRATHFTRLTLDRVDGRWLARLQTVAYAAQTRLTSGTVTSTLFGATDEAGLPDAVAEAVHQKLHDPPEGRRFGARQ